MYRREGVSFCRLIKQMSIQYIVAATTQPPHPHPLCRNVLTGDNRSALIIVVDVIFDSNVSFVVDVFSLADFFIFTYLTLFLCNVRRKLSARTILMSFPIPHLSIRKKNSSGLKNS